MAKVDIIRSFLVSHRQELPPTAEGLRKHITDISRGLNFKITGKEMQDLIAEFVPEEEKRPKKGVRREETTEAPAERE